MTAHPPRSLARGIFDFGTVGIVATATHLAVGLGLVHLRLLGPFGANIIAFLAAFTVSYFGHRTYSFRSSTAHGRALPRFLLVALSGLLMNQMTVVVVVHRMGLPYAAALVIVVTLIPTITYILGRYWAFSRSIDDKRANARD